MNQRAKRFFLSQQVLFGTKFLKFSPERPTWHPCSGTHILIFIHIRISAARSFPELRSNENNGSSLGALVRAN